MARRYLIKVNNKVYEVEVEEATSSASLPPSNFREAIPARPAVVPAPQVVTATPPQPVVQREGGKEVPAPMSGTVIKILCQVGQEVREGDVILKLEAMKMETDMAAPFPGRVKEILVAERQSVTAGDPLVLME